VIDVTPTALDAARDALAGAGLLGATQLATALARVERTDAKTLVLVFTTAGTDKHLLLEWVDHGGEEAPAFARGEHYAASYRRRPGEWDPDDALTPGPLREHLFAMCRTLAHLAPHHPLGPTGAVGPPAAARGADPAAVIDALVTELAAALARDLGSQPFANPEGWRVAHVRAFSFWRRVADLKLACADRTLSFIVFPTDPGEAVYARTARHDVVYYSDDLPKDRHADLYARDRATIDRFVAWLRRHDAERAGD
jgi:hypothetical protein